MKRDHRATVIERARRSGGRVMPACWRERRALRRMTVYGAARPLLGYPDIWEIPCV